jgi:hypothetical protein
MMIGFLNSKPGSRAHIIAVYGPAEWPVIPPEVPRTQSINQI